MSQAMNMMTDMAMQSVRHNNLDNERSRLNNISNSNDKALKEKELRKAAEGFEAIFIQKMWDEMRSSLPKNGMHYSKEEEYWQSMYSQELGKSMASAGGIGLADMMVEQLNRPTVSSPQTGTLSRIRMAVEPAPLVPEQNLQNKTETNEFSPAQHGIQTVAVDSAPKRPQQSSMPQNMYEEFNPQENLTAAAVNTLKTQQNQNMQAQEQQNQNMQAQQEAQQTQAVQQNPQFIRTTYITNLPPEKRNHAILDKNGNHIKKIEPKHTEKHSSQEVNTEFSMPVQNNKIITTNSTENFITNNQYSQTPVHDADTVQKKVSSQQQDILAGISTTYIPYRQRMAARLAQAATIQNTHEEHADTASPMQSTQASRSFRLPTLEEALTMGTLVASISDEEMASVQKKQTVSTTFKTEVKTKETTPTQHTEQTNTVSALAPNTEFQMPVQGTIRSSFGWRLDPATHQREWHKGIDIETTGTAVQASKAGTVTFAGKDSKLGNMLILDHGNGLESIYSHTGSLLVSKGDIISSGTQIAKINTESSSMQNNRTSLLHFEIRQNGLSINPEPYFSKE